METSNINSLIADLQNYMQKYYTLLTELKRIDCDDDYEYILRKNEICKDLKRIENKIISIKYDIRKNQMKSCKNHLYIVLAIKMHNDKEIYSLKCVNCKSTLLCLNGINNITNSKFIYLFNSKNDYYYNNDSLLQDLQNEIIDDFEKFIESHSIEETYEYIYNKYNKM